MIAYTDGSANPNPGPGGFGIVVLDNDENLITTHQEQEQNTTNNRMELKAILWAVLFCSNKDENLVIYSDSAYCINTITNWMYSWEKRGWLKSDNQPPENLDIIKIFFNLNNIGYKYELKKVKGHSGQKWNEMADLLATGKKV